MRERVHWCYCTNRGDNYHASGAPGCIAEDAHRDASPNQGDVEALAHLIGTGLTEGDWLAKIARTILDSDWYAERLTEAEARVLDEVAVGFEVIAGTQGTFFKDFVLERLRDRAAESRGDAS